MTSVLLAEQILNGLQFGVMLFLMSAGLTLIFGVMGLINLAHGSLYMVGAFVAAAVAGLTGSFLLALLAALMASAIAGGLVEMVVIRRLYNRNHLDQVLATFALILIFSEGTRWLFGSFPLYLDIPFYLQGPAALPGGIMYPLYRIALILMGLLVALALWLLVSRTRIGIQIRAGENDREMIAALGVDISRLYTFVFALGAALAGLAGALVGDNFSYETAAKDNNDGGPPSGGEFILAICPDKTAGTSWQKHAEEFFEKMKSMGEVRLPGERRHKNRQDTGPRNINEELVNKIKSLS